MTEEGFKRKLTAILSADVIGYSRLMRDDEEATVRNLAAHRVLISEIIQQHHGRVVDSPGDNILAEFSSVVDAVDGAIKILKEIKKSNTDTPGDRRMEFRIGINLGDVIEEKERIYGDGVNIAARVEGLASAGGISIAATVYEHIKDKLSLGYHYLGEQDVKNIPEPVRVYRLLTEPADVGKVIGEEKKLPKAKWIGVAAATITIILLVIVRQRYNKKPAAIKEEVSSPASFEKPSIAVLPFDNMSNDPEREYFSNGISDDLITDLSKVPNFLVISRNTSFAYKSKSLTIEQIAGELDVRYVLEGSVPKANNIVRINAQLIDATTGHHLWAERYDGNTSDIFALQDKITQKIAASLAVKLTEDEQDRLTQKDTNNTDAYEAFLKGLDLANYIRMDPEGLAKSLSWFEKAIELDSDYSLAYAALAESYWRGSIVGIHRKLGILYRLARLRAINYLHISMKNPTNIAYRNLARVYSAQRQHEKATDYAMKAIALDPNDPDTNSIMAQTLIFSGRPDEAIYFAEQIE